MKDTFSFGGKLDKHVYRCYIINMEYTYDNHAVHLIAYHIIWCPRRRRKVLHGPVHDRLKQITHEVAHENSWEILELAIQLDHVHIFLRSNPYTLPTNIARLMKSRSSRILREEFPHLKRMPSTWTRSAFYSTAENVSSEVIQEYIEKQSRNI